MVTRSKDAHTRVTHRLKVTRSEDAALPARYRFVVAVELLTKVLVIVCLQLRSKIVYHTCREDAVLFKMVPQAEQGICRIPA